MNLIVTFCICTLLSGLTIVNCELYFECVDYKSDAEALKWEGDPNYSYVDSSSELPEELKDKLEGQGIFYFKGDPSQRNQTFFKMDAEKKLESPSYLYLKYYGLTRNAQSEIYVIPGPTVLRSSYGFVWSEAVVRVDLPQGSWSGSYPEFGTGRFQQGEFFLVDRFAIVSGYTHSLTAQEVEKLCWSSATTTTTMSSSANTSPDSTITSVDPEVTTQENEPNSEDPDSTTQKYGTTNPVPSSPDSTASPVDPEVTTQENEPNSEEPESTTQKYGTTNLVPSSTTVKEVTTTNPFFVCHSCLSTLQIFLYIIVPGIGLIALVILIMYVCRRRRRRRSPSTSHLVIM